MVDERNWELGGSRNRSGHLCHQRLDKTTTSLIASCWISPEQVRWEMEIRQCPFRWSLVRDVHENVSVFFSSGGVCVGVTRSCG